MADDIAQASSRLPAHRPRPVYGLIAMITATALIAMTTLIAKALGQGVGAGPDGGVIHPLQVSAGRFLFAWLALIPFVVWLRPPLGRTNLLAHAGRSLCGWAGVSCLFAASAAMRLADATAISFLSPIVAMILAYPLLGEKVGPWRWLAALIAAAGAMILIQPGAGTIHPMVVLALAAALFMGLESILIKVLAGREAPLAILSINNTMGMIIALSAAAFVWIEPTPAQSGLLAALGTIMVCAQACFIQAMRNGDASLVMPVFYATLVFATLYDFAIFAVVPPASSFAGAGLILAGSVLLAYRESRAPRVS
jgi:drug/metabolite transporter (DMT)-like permease